jgi:beta-1,4-N-acetylglucosaminyltransferase
MIAYVIIAISPIHPLHTGTCVPIVFVAFLYKLLGILDADIVFVESFCRVQKLSLTGKLLYPIADKFIVQWPQLLRQYGRAEYLGDFKTPVREDED